MNIFTFRGVRPGIYTHCLNFAQFSTFLKPLVCSLLLIFWIEVAWGCEPDRFSLDSFPFSTTVSQAPAGSGYQWAIYLHLGTPNEVIKGLHGFQITLEVEDGIDGSAGQGTDFSGSWIKNGGQSHSSNLSYDEITQQLSLDFELDSCAMATGQGFVGSILIKDDGTGIDPLTFVEQAIGQVMIENVQARPDFDNGGMSSLNEIQDDRSPKDLSPEDVGGRGLGVGAKVYPNPASSYFIVDPGQASLVRIQCMDVSGRILRVKEAVEESVRFSTSGLPEGPLLIHIQYPDGNRVTRRLLHLK